MGKTTIPGQRYRAHLLTTMNIPYRGAQLPLVLLPQNHHATAGSSTRRENIPVATLLPQNNLLGRYRKETSQGGGYHLKHTIPGKQLAYQLGTASVTTGFSCVPSGNPKENPGFPKENQGCDRRIFGIVGGIVLDVFVAPGGIVQFDFLLALLVVAPASVGRCRRVFGIVGGIVPMAWSVRRVFGIGGIVQFDLAALGTGRCDHRVFGLFVGGLVLLDGIGQFDVFVASRASCSLTPHCWQQGLSVQVWVVLARV